MSLPKAELTLEETEVIVALSAPCPCGRNNMVECGITLGVSSYRSLVKKAYQCGGCNRKVKAIYVNVDNDAFPKTIKIEYDYAELSDSNYWEKHKAIEANCILRIDEERVRIPQLLADDQIVHSKTFVCWWENRLGLIPTLVIEQKL